MKRFGRNQKRKLKMELAHAQTLCTTYERLVVNAQRSEIELRERVHKLYTVLCSDFNKFHPLNETVTSSGTLAEDIFYINQYARDGKYLQAVLYLLKLDVWPDEYRNNVAIRVQHKDKASGYYLSNYELTNSSYTVEELSRKIAIELDKHLRSKHDS